MTYLSLLAFIAGAAISVQASLNAQLGQILKSALLATSIAFTSSLVYILLSLVIFSNSLPSVETFRSVPHYLWYSGGLFSAFAVALFYWLIPKMGIGSMMSFALSGQFLFAVIAGHFGWFQLPIAPISVTKVVGIVSLVIGIILINRG